MLPADAPELISTALSSPFDDVRLWLVDLDGQAPSAADPWLSPSERARAERFVFPHHAKRYRAAHAALRYLLWQQCGVPPGVEFEIGAHGKPGLGDRGTTGFNMAHSDAQALIGIGEGDGIGVDMEMLRAVDDVWALAELNLSANELCELRRMPASGVARAFLLGWTRKEACLKALGQGLNIAPNSLDVGLDSCSRTVTVELDSGATEVCVRAVAAGEDMLAAVARIARHGKERSALHEHTRLLD